MKNSTNIKMIIIILKIIILKENKNIKNNFRMVDSLIRIINL